MTDVLGVDVGKGGCRARWCASGIDGGVGVGPGVPHIAEPGASEAIVKAIVTAADAAGSPTSGVDTVCAGVTGLLEADDRASHLAVLLLDALSARCAVVTGDVVTSHVGALAGGAGVVVAAGTGSVALGVDPSGRHAKVDGLGYILGDQGSGFAVGRRGLASALRHHDGRGGSATLAALAERMFGRLDRLAAEVYASENPPATVARFAPAVAAAARSGRCRRDRHLARRRRRARRHGDGGARPARLDRGSGAAVLDRPTLRRRRSALGPLRRNGGGARTEADLAVARAATRCRAPFI